MPRGVGLAPVVDKALPGQRRFLEALQFRVYGELLDDHILSSLKKAMDKKDKNVPLPDLQELVTRTRSWF